MLELDGTLIIAIISFVIFAFIMNVVLYQPIIKILEERRIFLENNEKCMKLSNDEAEKISLQKQKELETARKIASQNVSSNLEKIKQNQKNITDNYRKEQAEIIEIEKQKLLQEENSAKQELQSGIENISDLISEKILGERNV
ncbi:hypothetical protein IJG14_05015 [bacterium]|nr:hypothetical protein [bacterium]